MNATVGIEKACVNPCSMVLPLERLCAARGSDVAYARDSLMLHERGVNPPWEDTVTMAVNAGRALLAPAEIQQVGLLLVATESGVDQAKPVSAWVHRFLGLPRDCRNLELKHACYAGTGALQLAATWVSSPLAAGRKALVISADESRMHLGKPWELVAGACSAAALVSTTPDLVELEQDKTGVYANEQADDITRPTLHVEKGNTELSLASYLDALEGAYDSYLNALGVQIDPRRYFKRQIYHAPFGGITLLAHKAILERSGSVSRLEMRADFARRCEPGLRYTRRVGAAYASSTLASLLSTLAAGDELHTGDRIGVYAFGSGSCAEYYSVLVGERAQQTARAAGFDRLADTRQVLTVEGYEQAERQRACQVDLANFATPLDGFDDWYDRRYRGSDQLVFLGCRDYIRQYAWS